MNISNRRLTELQREKAMYQDSLRKADNIADSLIYQGKIDSLEKEEKEILERYGVKI